MAQGPGQVELNERGFPYLVTATMLLFFSLVAVLLTILASSIGRGAWSAALSLLVLAGPIYLIGHPSRSYSGQAIPSR